MDKPEDGAKSKISKERVKQIEKNIEEIDDNAKQLQMQGK